MYWQISCMGIFLLKSLVVGILNLFSGMWNDALMHRGGLKGERLPNLVSISMFRVTRNPFMWFILNSAYKASGVYVLQALLQTYCSNIVIKVVSEYCFKSLSVQSWPYRDRIKPEIGTCPTLIEWLQGFFIVHSIIDSTVHSKPLNNLEHCICTTSTTSIQPSRD